jgi:hypothetical protein
MDSRTIALDSKDLEGGIEALSSAARAFRLTRFERAAYYTLVVSVYVTAWLSITIFLGIAAVVLFLGLAFTVDEEGNFIKAIVIMSTVNQLILCLAIVALVLNIPLASRLYRERGRLKELGLVSLSKSLWKARRRGRWISQAFRWAPVIGLAIVGLWGTWSLSTVSGRGVVTNPDLARAYFVVMLVCIIALLILSGYLRNQRERMEIAANAEELKKALQDLQRSAGKSGNVSVPSELLEEAARIETAQIAKERKDAVLQSVSVGPSGYGVAFDPAAAEQRRMLDVPDRVEFEDEVAQLSIDGPDKDKSDAGAVAPLDGPSRRGETKSKHVEFEYVVDRASRGIRIIAVRRQDHSNGSLKGPSHA